LSSMYDITFVNEHNFLDYIERLITEWKSPFHFVVMVWIPSHSSGGGACIYRRHRSK
jgi:hypothetical protein